MLQGQIEVEQDGHRAQLDPGDLAWYRSGEPYELVSTAPHTLVHLCLPVRYAGVLRQALGPAATKATPGSPAPQLLAPYLTSLATSPGVVRPTARLGASLLHLIATISPQAPEEQTTAGDHYHRATQVIETRLDQVGLAPAEVAAACHLSVRYLHLLFAREGTTFGTYLRERRLARSLDLLLDPAQTERPVREIALACGFASPAHFSRTFRQRYGNTPGSMRTGAA